MVDHFPGMYETQFAIVSTRNRIRSEKKEVKEVEEEEKEEKERRGKERSDEEMEKQGNAAKFN